MKSLLIFVLFILSTQALDLRVCALNDPPNLLIDNTTGTPQYSGFYYDLINLVFQTAGYAPNFTFYVVPDNNFGAFRNGSWNGAVGEMLSNKSDLFAGLLNPTLQRFNSGIKFSRSVQQGGYVILVRQPKFEVDPFSIFNPFTLKLWGLLLGTIMAMSIIFYVLDRISPYGFYYDDDKERRKQSSKKKKKFFNIFNVNIAYREMVHSAFMTAFQKDTEFGASITFRLLQGFYFFFAIILISTYTANLTTFLLANKAVPVVSTLDDIKEKGIKFTTVANSAPATYLSLPQNSALLKTLVYSQNTEESIQMVLNKTVDAFVWVKIFFFFLKIQIHLFLIFNSLLFLNILIILFIFIQKIFNLIFYFFRQMLFWTITPINRLAKHWLWEEKI